MATINLSDGTPLYYEIYGWENEGPPIIFLNGMSQSTLHWGTHIRHFEKYSKVIVYNARGQGGQPIGDLPLTLERHCDDLIHLLDALAVDKANPVGFSHGARVALGLASYHPNRVNQLTLVSATNQMTERAKLIVESWVKVLELSGLEAMTWTSLPTILGNDYLSKNQKLIPGIIKASLQRNSTEGITALLKSMQKFPVLQELTGRVQAPSLVISATDDPLVTPEGAEALANALNGRYVLIENCGHTIPIEVPNRFQKLVGEFLSV